MSQVENGHIKRITDNDIHSEVLEVEGRNVRWACVLNLTRHRFLCCTSTCTHPSTCSFSTTYIMCPGDPRKTLGIKLPFFVMIIKGLKRYFSFEVQVGTLKSNNFQLFAFMNIFLISQWHNQKWDKSILHLFYFHHPLDNGVRKSMQPWDTPSWIALLFD